MTSAGSAGSAPSPFRGLSAFTDSDQDAAYFYGRETESEIVVANFLASRLTLLYGRSGVGKSSLLRAGVVRRVRALSDLFGADPEIRRSVVVLVDDWSGDIGARLCATAHEALGDVASGAGARHLEAVMVDGPGSEGIRRSNGGERPEAGGSCSATARLADLCDDYHAELLLVFDRFEDYLYTHPPGTDESADRDLAAIFGSASLPFHVIVALRDDALAGLDRFKGRVPSLFDVTYRLNGLTAAAARRAIQEPVVHYRERTGQPVVVEPELVDAVVAELGDVESAPDAAADACRIEPVHLQMVLSRVWDAEQARGSTRLRVGTLRDLGGAAAIIERHFDERMAQLPPTGRRLAAAMLSHLIAPSRITVRYTSADLAHYTGADERTVATLLEELAGGRYRVLRAVDAPVGSASRPAYQIFHDTLAAPALSWSRDYERRRLQRRAARLSAALVALAALTAGLIVYIWNPPAVRRLELSALDARFAIRGHRSPDPALALVAAHSPPPSRSEQAAVMNRLGAAGARVIAYDIIFDLPTAPKRDTAQLRAAIRRWAPRVVLATGGVTTVVSSEGRVPFRDCGAVVQSPARLTSEPLLLTRRHVETYASAGFAGFPNDPGPVVRRVAYRITPTFSTAGYPSFAACTAMLARGHQLPRTLPTGSRIALGTRTGQEAWVNFSGPAGRYRPYDFEDVLSGKVPARAFRGKVVLVGWVNPPREQFRTATTGQRSMSGLELQASAVSTLLRGAPLRDVDPLVDILVLIAVAVLPALIWWLRLPAWRLLGLPLVLLLLLVGIQLAFDGGAILAVVPPLVAFAVAAIAVLSVETHRRSVSARRQRPTSTAIAVSSPRRTA